jgi:hypothetical protein
MIANEVYTNTLKHINALEGFKTLFKALHWSAKTISMHKVIDHLLDDLIDYEDTIAEAAQGYDLIQFDVTDIIPIPAPACDGAMVAITHLRVSVDVYLTEIAAIPGLANIVNDFQSKLLRHTYLLLLASRC